MMILQFSTALLVSALGVFAAPVFNTISFASRDVWAPPITVPNSDTIWTVGAIVNATWDTSTRPAQVSSSVGTLVLGYLNSDESGGENLDIEHPLAQYFDLNDGYVTFVVPTPTVQPDSDHQYIVALIGDSGNISQEFTIIV